MLTVRARLRLLLHRGIEAAAAIDLRLSHAAECSSRGTGSNSRFGPDFQAFGFNGMEMVDQTVKSWNRLTSWLGMLEQLRSAA